MPEAIFFIHERAILASGAMLTADRSPHYLAPGACALPEPPLSVRSARARDLAHRLARRERRSIADIVERALEA